MTFPEDEYPPANTGSNRRAVALAAATLLPPALLVGLLLALPESDPPDQEPAQAAAAAPAAVADGEAVVPAAPAGPDPVAALQAAHDRVETLQAALEARDAELGALRAAGEKLTEEQKTRVATLQKQVTKLKASVAEAVAERTELRDRLATALADLERETGEHAKVREHAAALEGANTENLWVAFVQQAELEICQQFTKRGRAACKDRITSWFDDARHDRFASCVSDSRTVPVLWRSDGVAEAPTNGERIMEGGFGQRKDWYVLYCDPTLPEAQVASADLPPPVFVPTPWKSR